MRGHNMFSLRKEKNISELSSVPPLIWRSVALPLVFTSLNDIAWTKHYFHFSRRILSAFLAILGLDFPYCYYYYHIFYYSELLTL